LKHNLKNPKIIKSMIKKLCASHPEIKAGADYCFGQNNDNSADSQLEKIK